MMMAVVIKPLSIRSMYVFGVFVYLTDVEKIALSLLPGSEVGWPVYRVICGCCSVQQFQSENISRRIHERTVAVSLVIFQVTLS
jgi:hypothetical protein